MLELNRKEILKELIQRANSGSVMISVQYAKQKVDEYVQNKIISEIDKNEILGIEEEV